MWTVQRTPDAWVVAPDAVFARLWRILKPGGVLGVIDHVALINPADDPDVSVFTPENKGTTSRFVHRYRKVRR